MFNIGDIVCLRTDEEIIDIFGDNGKEWIKGSEYLKLRGKNIVIEGIIGGYYLKIDVDGITKGLNAKLFTLASTVNEIKEDELRVLLI